MLYVHAKEPFLIQKHRYNAMSVARGISKGSDKIPFFTLCAYAAGLCVWSRQFVYIYMCIHCMWPKNWLFEVLPLGNLLLVESTAHSSSLTAKKGAYNVR